MICLHRNHFKIKQLSVGQCVKLVRTLNVSEIHVEQSCMWIPIEMNGFQLQNFAELEYTFGQICSLEKSMLVAKAFL